MASLAARAYHATWGRMFAAVYDRMGAATEEAGLRDLRAGLLAGARGRTLELGAGTGLNLEHYPEAVTELVLTEPFGPMAQRLRERTADSAREVQVVEAAAGALPFADASFDTVVATLVLCTVEDVPGVLAEIDRVLAPGGRFLFCEHVRSSDPAVARKQDRWERPWQFVGHGCHPNRDTVAAIASSPLELGAVRDERLPKAPQIVRPLAIGTAGKPA
jgi:ubiquinone/menaquinone biosynthesis C-methylase UbiE